MESFVVKCTVFNKKLETFTFCPKIIWTYRTVNSASNQTMPSYQAAMVPPVVHLSWRCVPSRVGALLLVQLRQHPALCPAPATAAVYSQSKHRTTTTDWLHWTLLDSHASNVQLQSASAVQCHVVFSSGSLWSEQSNLLLFLTVCLKTNFDLYDPVPA